MYNQLHVELPCRECGTKAERILQFYIGFLQLKDYRVGDDLEWWTAQEPSDPRVRALRRKHGPNSGHPDQGRVWSPAYSVESCPVCGDDSEYAGFAVIVEGSTIVGARSAPPGQWFPEHADVNPLDDGADPIPVGPCSVVQSGSGLCSTCLADSRATCRGAR